MMFVDEGDHRWIDLREMKTSEYGIAMSYDVADSETAHGSCKLEGWAL